MRERLRDLGLRQSVVHADVHVAGQLSHLPRRHQGADCNEAPVTRRKAWPQPKITEENVRRVLHDAWKYRAEQVADALGAIRFGGFVERQQVWRLRAATDQP